MNRIHEEKQVVPVILPQSMASGATITGTYKSIEGGMHDVLFNVVCGALAATKKVTVKVYQANDIAADGEAEIIDAASVFTAPGGGATKVQIQVSIPLAQLTKSFATVKVTNDAAGPVLGYAEMVLDARDRNKDCNSQADVVTVL